MPKTRSKKVSKKPEEPTAKDQVLTVRVSDQEMSWIKDLQNEYEDKHGMRLNQSAIVRMLIRKAASNLSA